jgi:hypothetical protein
VPRPPHRQIVLAASAVLAALSPLLPACTAGGASGNPAPDRPAGHRTLVEREVAGASLVVEVLQSPAGMAGTWSARTPKPRTLAREIRIGTDVWVRMSVTEAEGITDPAWIHVDLTERWQRSFLAADPVGLVDQRHLWRARPGDDVDGDEVVAVDRVSGTERLLRLAGGGSVRVTRERLARPPRIAAPTSPRVVPLREVDEVLARP